MYVSHSSYTTYWAIMPTYIFVLIHIYMHAAHQANSDHLSLNTQQPTDTCCCCQLYVVNQAGFTKQHVQTESFHHCTDLLYPAHICISYYLHTQPSLTHTGMNGNIYIYNLPLHIRTECVSTATACCTVPANIYKLAALGWQAKLEEICETLPCTIFFTCAPKVILSMQHVHAT
jgi:hypothetical protein